MLILLSPSYSPACCIAATAGSASSTRGTHFTSSRTEWITSSAISNDPSLHVSWVGVCVYKVTVTQQLVDYVERGVFPDVTTTVYKYTPTVPANDWVAYSQNEAIQLEATPVA